MTPISLTMRGFMSFRDEFTFHFPSAPGLYYLRGDNRKEPRLGANGAGKSSLWSALYWLSFETTPKGLRAVNIANWETGKGVSVSFCYHTGDEQHVVTRTWGPNSWTMVTVNSGGDPFPTVDLTKSVDNPYLNHLKLGPAAFLHCILMAQRKEMFLDMRPEAKVSVLSDVLGLDAWIEHSATANKKAAEQDRVTRLLEQRVADLSGQLRGYTETDYTGKSVEWENKRTVRINELATLHEAGKQREAVQRTVVDSERIKVESLRSSYRDCTYELEGITPKAREVERELDKQIALSDRLTTDGNRLGAEAVALKSWKCPACLQPMNNITQEIKTRDHRKAVESTATDMQVCLAAIEKLQAQLNLLSLSITKITATAGAQRERLQLAERELQRNQNDLQYLSRDLDRIEDEAERIEKEVNPFDALQTTQQENRADVEQRLDDAKYDLDNSTTKHALQLLWVKGFKEIRLFDMATALTELELEVNSSVSELGLQDWTINFALDRETGKGEIKRGFSVFVQSPDNVRPVPWEVWSGGESQRLRLAGTMGLSDLIRSQSGCGLALEVWDEPTDGMSSQGITDLLNSLKERAQREQRQIWVVDHHALGYGAFDGVYTVVKDATGSHVEQE